jgi:hypothetical protein
MSNICASDGLMRRNSWRMLCRAISAIAPAISTPVGPPPTITKVSSDRRRSASVSRSARTRPEFLVVEKRFHRLRAILGGAEVQGLAHLRVQIVG